jgi:phosphotriesterase-related protein
MLSHDYIANWLGRPVKFPEPFLSLMVNWHPSHILDNVVPALKRRGVTDAQIKTILTDNPRHLFENPIMGV